MDSFLRDTIDAILSPSNLRLPVPGEQDEDREQERERRKEEENFVRQQNPVATSEILAAFKTVLEAKSRMQAGYREFLVSTFSNCFQELIIKFSIAYNLKYDHGALSPFLNFSINNLGDPFEVGRSCS